MDDLRRLFRLQTAIGLALIAAVFAAVAFTKLQRGPEATFLEDVGGAQWIAVDLPTNLMSRNPGILVASFRTTFELASVPEPALLAYRAVHFAQFIIDGQIIQLESPKPADWRLEHQLDLTSFLAPGPHRLEILVQSNNAPTLLLASAPALGLATGASWEATIDGRNWAPALVASQGPRPSETSREFPHAGRALLGRIPFLLPIFLLVSTWSLLASRRSGFWRPSASTVRWCVLTAWVVLALNNILKIPHDRGMDIESHVAYVRHLVEQWSVPLATQGAEMMQAPLAYLVMAPLYALFSPLLASESLVQLLRVVPLACGIGLVELCYRTLRSVYPGREDLQAIGTVLGGLLPVNLYLCQFVANEPMAALTGGAVVVLAIRMLMSAEPPGTRMLMLTGLAFGLALLSKVTTALLGPPLMAVVAFRSAGPGRSARPGLRGIGVVGGVALLVAGWYYARNMLLIGVPFAGTWDSAVGASWWQEPGYRTASQYLRFGEALAYPVYSAAVGFWDGLYSSLWLDGYLSGMPIRAWAPDWNFSFVIAGAWLAILPTLALGLGAASAFLPPAASPVGLRTRAAGCFAVSCVALYLGAVLALNIQVPYYCVAKASYLAAATPCLAVLGAAGFDWLTRNRLLRSVVLGLLSCWAVSAYAGYFVL
jgi:hypothetical protein